MLPIHIDDTWAAAEGSTEDGAPLVLRVRSHLQALMGHPELPNRLLITWAYAPDGAPERSGMPSPEQMATLTACEEALVAGLESGADPAAVLIAVWTGGGHREWLWYGTEPGRLEAAVNEALGALPPYPLELELEADPDWQEYTGLLADLQLP